MVGKDGGLWMEIVEWLNKKLSDLENKKRILSLINSNLIMVILTLLFATQSTGSREFLLNGVSDKVINSLTSAADLSNTGVVQIFIKGMIILTLLWLALFIVLLIIQHFIKTIRFQYILLLINTTLFGLVNVSKQPGNIIFNIIISLIVLYVFYYILLKKNIFSIDSLEISPRKSKVILVSGFLCYVTVIGGITIIKYINYQQSMFDTSIFCQMFYYMSKWGLPFTTVERQRLMSHFAVHFSPIYYLLLPGFMIFKSAIYLTIAKTLLMASGVFPLYKLCKKKGLTNLLSVMLSISYLIFPMLIASNIGNGNGHVLNENYFYCALLFWIFYYVEEQNFKLLWVFCIITLFVKEDAPIILACLGLYLILSKKSNFHGKLLFIISVLYFFVCTKFIMPRFGIEYIIANLYSNFVPDASLAFPSIMYALIYKPSYVFQQIFTGDKLTFLLQLMAPLMLMPLLALKKVQNFVLMIPIILTSLLCLNPSYIYKLASHHNMAPICICFYLTILTLSEIKSKKHQFFITLSILLVTAIFSLSYNIDKGKILNYYIENGENINLTDIALSKIPENASVTADSGFSTKLTNRLNLYLYFDPNCDYVVINLRNTSVKWKKQTIGLLLGKDYGVTDYKKNLYLILLKGHSTQMNLGVYEDQFLQ